MLISAKTLHGYQLQATDGEVGAITDLLFDDEVWRIRFLVARLQKVLPWSEKVLINSLYLKKPDRRNQLLNVELDRESIRKCPPLSSNMPVSMREQSRAFKNYGYAGYWSAPGVGATLPHPAPLIDEIRDDLDDITQEDTHLRSCKSVCGYHIHTQDGGIGHVEDFIIDVEHWSCAYLLVNTRNWLPGGRDVLVSREAVEDISWSKHQVQLAIATEAIKQAPHFDIDKLNQPLIARELESDAVLPRAS